jgi:hypothetical protein
VARVDHEITRVRALRVEDDDRVAGAEALDPSPSAVTVPAASAPMRRGAVIGGEGRVPDRSLGRSD